MCPNVPALLHDILVASQQLKEQSANIMGGVVTGTHARMHVVNYAEALELQS